MKQIYPDFSVLVSVYYKENPKWLKESIDSVLSNTVLPKQIVIVKDGKLSNELEEVLSVFEGNPLFQIVGYEENKGLGFALNYGLRYCKYDYVARMDADDICANNRFEEQLSLFVKDEALGLVGSSVSEFIDCPSNVVAIKKVPRLHSDILKYCKKRNPFNHPTVMFVKDKILQVGGYMDMYRYEDYFLWYRVLKNNVKTQNVENCLVNMRVSNAFFQRRGGLKAFKQRMRLNRIMFQDRFVNFGTFLIVFFVNLFNLLIPNCVRKFLYFRFLRKKPI